MMAPSNKLWVRASAKPVIPKTTITSPPPPPPNSTTDMTRWNRFTLSTATTFTLTVNKKPQMIISVSTKVTIEEIKRFRKMEKKGHRILPKKK
uniref:Uncharacterized protein n=1 Tax=Tetranychus urticae TaxID=32264 RepID=T1K0C8_TETUR